MTSSLSYAPHSAQFKGHRLISESNLRSDCGVVDDKWELLSLEFIDGTNADAIDVEFGMLIVDECQAVANKPAS